MEIGCDRLEEVKFICRQQLSKVWGWVGVNYYSSEAKFTCLGICQVSLNCLKRGLPNQRKQPSEQRKPICVFIQLQSQNPCLGIRILLQPDIQRASANGGFFT